MSEAFAKVPEPPSPLLSVLSVPHTGPNTGTKAPGGELTKLTQAPSVGSVSSSQWA